MKKGIICIVSLLMLVNSIEAGGKTEAKQSAKEEKNETSSH